MLRAKEARGDPAPAEEGIGPASFKFCKLKFWLFLWVFTIFVTFPMKFGSLGGMQQWLESVRERESIFEKRLSFFLSV